MEFERHAYADQLNIETPEQVDLRFPVAGIGSRFVAILLDHVIQFGVYFVLGLALVLWAKSIGPEQLGRSTEKLDNAGKWFLAIFIFVNFCIIWGYFALFEAFWHGQTPGKRIMKLRVIKDNGRQITFFEALARNLLRIIDYAPSAYLVGVITMLCNKRNKRLGDLAAGTMVVHEIAALQPLLPHDANDLFIAREAAPVPNAFPADALARLDAADLNLVETFFARALDLTVEMRAQMAERIATKLSAKMNVALPEGNPERALETIAKQMRSSGRRF